MEMASSFSLLECEVVYEARAFPCVIDTGSSLNLMSARFASQIGLSDAVHPSKLFFKVADGSVTHANGKLRDVPLSFGAITLRITFAVVDHCCHDLLLGTSFMSETGTSLCFDLVQPHMKLTEGRIWEEIPLTYLRTHQGLSTSRRKVKVPTDSREDWRRYDTPIAMALVALDVIGYIDLNTQDEEVDIEGLASKTNSAGPAESAIAVSDLSIKEEEVSSEEPQARTQRDEEEISPEDPRQLFVTYREPSSDQLTQGCAVEEQGFLSQASQVRLSDAADTTSEDFHHALFQGGLWIGQKHAPSNTWSEDRPPEKKTAAFLDGFQLECEEARKATLSALAASVDQDHARSMEFEEQGWVKAEVDQFKDQLDYLKRKKVRNRHEGPFQVGSHCRISKSVAPNCKGKRKIICRKDIFRVARMEGDRVTVVAVAGAGEVRTLPARDVLPIALPSSSSDVTASGGYLPTPLSQAADLPGGQADSCHL